MLDKAELQSNKYLVVRIVLGDIPALELPPDLDLGRIWTLNWALELGSLSEQRSLEIFPVEISVLADRSWKQKSRWLSVSMPLAGSSYRSLKKVGY